MNRATGGGMDQTRLDAIVSKAKQERATRERDYRERALKLYPWICGRCGREFTRANLQELTVHHRDHNHDNNPQDGSNWELLCVYCHDNEHQRHVDQVRGAGYERPSAPASKDATHRPFEALGSLLKPRS